MLHTFKVYEGNPILDSWPGSCKVRVAYSSGDSCGLVPPGCQFGGSRSDRRFEVRRGRIFLNDQLCNALTLSPRAFHIASRLNIHAYDFARGNEKRNLNSYPVLERGFFPGIVLMGMCRRRGSGYSRLGHFREEDADGLPLKEFDG